MLKKLKTANVPHYYCANNYARNTIKKLDDKKYNQCESGVAYTLKFYINIYDVKVHQFVDSILSTNIDTIIKLLKKNIEQNYHKDRKLAICDPSGRNAGYIDGVVCHVKGNSFTNELMYLRHDCRH